MSVITKLQQILKKPAASSLSPQETSSSKSRASGKRWSIFGRGRAAVEASLATERAENSQATQPPSLAWQDSLHSGAISNIPQAASENRLSSLAVDFW